MSFNRRALGVIAVLTLFVPALAARAELVERDFHKSIEVSSSDRLYLKFGDGDVEITPWEKDELDVTIRYKAEHRRHGVGVGKRSDFSVDFSRVGNVIRIVGHEPSYGGIFIGASSRHRVEYTYTVRAPAYLPLELRGDDGDLEVSQWTGAIEIVSDDGDAHLENVGSVDAHLEDGDLTIDGQRGFLQLRADDGDVTVRNCVATEVEVRLDDGNADFSRCSGDFRITTEDGDVRLVEIETSRLSLRSDDGDAFLDLSSGPGELDLEAETEDGNIDLQLDPGVSAQFDITTGDGRIELEADEATEVSKRDKRLSGVLGTGAGLIRIRTDDGRVSLSQKGT